MLVFSVSDFHGCVTRALSSDVDAIRTDELVVAPENASQADAPKVCDLLRFCCVKNVSQFDVLSVQKEETTDVEAASGAAVSECVSWPHPFYSRFIVTFQRPVCICILIN